MVIACWLYKKRTHMALIHITIILLNLLFVILIIHFSFIVLGYITGISTSDYIIYVDIYLFVGIVIIFKERTILKSQYTSQSNSANAMSLLQRTFVRFESNTLKLDFDVRGDCFYGSWEVTLSNRNNIIIKPRFVCVFITSYP